MPDVESLLTGSRPRAMIPAGEMPSGSPGRHLWLKRGCLILPTGGLRKWVALPSDKVLHELVISS